MHILSLVFTVTLPGIVYGAAFNPLYHKTKSRSTNEPEFSGVSVPANKTYDWTRSNLSRPSSKRLYWLPSRKNQITRRRLPDSVSKNPTTIEPRDMRPTPAPTGEPSPFKTVHITNEEDFSLIAPANPGEQIANAEADGVSFCSSGAAPSENCSRRLPGGFITAAAVKYADDGAWVQVTGCIDPSKFPMSTSDDGGQFDVRYPNGALCTFGQYGASFIEQIEPSASRFCLRCCKSENDQRNCNSHQDRAGCRIAVPGTYDFPNIGISCL